MVSRSWRQMYEQRDYEGLNFLTRVLRHHTGLAVRDGTFSWRTGLYFGLICDSPPPTRPPLGATELLLYLILTNFRLG